MELHIIPAVLFRKSTKLMQYLQARPSLTPCNTRGVPGRLAVKGDVGVWLGEERQIRLLSSLCYQARAAWGNQWAHSSISKSVLIPAHMASPYASAGDGAFHGQAECEISSNRSRWHIACHTCWRANSNIGVHDILYQNVGHCVE